MSEYKSRLKSDYQKTFKTASGKHVLMDLYTHLGGKHSSWPQSGDSHELAFNEGKRWAWLRVMSQLRTDDIEMNRLYSEHIASRQSEEMNT